MGLCDLSLMVMVVIVIMGVVMISRIRLVMMLNVCLKMFDSIWVLVKLLEKIS